MAMFNRRFLWTEVAVIATIYLGCVYCYKEPLIARCPSSDSPAGEEAIDYCECSSRITRSGQTVSIKCDFNNTEDVVLTEAFYPFRNKTLVSAYVRVVNASSVHVSRAFLTELLLSPSIALDMWRARTLILDSMPQLDDPQKFKGFKTFVGVGIVSCFVPEVPKNFLRDRTRGGLRIKSSHVGNFHEGVLNNMEEMRYLVFEDSRVDFVEGPVAREGYVTLSKRRLHSWNGLIISNVTIDTISSNAFNLTHKSDMETAVVVNSRIGSVNTGALVISGDIDVTIQENVFGRMETKAFKVAVTGDVIFDKNTIESWEPDALEGLICHNRTSMEKNTFLVDNPVDIAMNISATPFHTSCGNPQLFMVIKVQHPLAITVTTTSSWSLGGVLLIVMMMVVFGAVYAHQRQNLMMHYYRSRGRTLMDFRERKLSQENLPNGAEIEPSAEAAAANEEGMTNPIYVGVQEAS